MSRLQLFRPQVGKAPLCEPLEPCDLCGGEEFFPLWDRDRCGRELRTVICRGCGLVRHAQVPSHRELQQFYAQQYRRTYHGERAPSVRRVVRAWCNGLRIFGQLRPWLWQEMRVLEVGAGVGATVKVFQLHGTQAQGIDPGEDFCRWGAEHLKAHLRCLSLEQLPVERNWDLVLLVHVIEHLRRPSWALKRIGQLVGAGGMLYVECPNLIAPLARPGRWFHQAHIYNFTPKTLLTLAARCGWQPLQVFSEPDDPNLQVLFVRQSGRAWAPDPQHWVHVVAALNRYTTLGYHLRWSYLRRRWGKCRQYFWERTFGPRFLKRVLRVCQGHLELRGEVGLGPPLPQAPQLELAKAA